MRMHEGGELHWNGEVWVVFGLGVMFFDFYWGGMQPALMRDMLLGEKVSYLRQYKSICEAINVQQPVRLCMVATVLRRTEISEGVPKRRAMRAPVVCVRMGLARNKAGATFHCLGVE